MTTPRHGGPARDPYVARRAGGPARPGFPVPPAWPPPTPHTRRSGRHLVGYPATALVALLLGVVVGATGGADTAGDGGTGVTTAAESSATTGASPRARPGASKPAKTPKKRTSGIGKRYRDGKFQFTVTRVRSGVRQIGSDTVGARAQGQFVLVSMTVKNTGDQPQSLFGDNQKLFDAAGRRYSADTAAALYLENANRLWEEIGPGDSVRGVIVFDVPPGVKPAKLELHDAQVSRGVEVPLR